MPACLGSSTRARPGAAPSGRITCTLPTPCPAHLQEVADAAEAGAGAPLLRNDTAGAGVEPAASGDATTLRVEALADAGERFDDAASYVTAPSREVSRPASIDGDALNKA